MTDIEPRRIRKILRRDEPVGETASTHRHAALAYSLTKPRAVDGFVTLTQLAAERGIQSQLARIWMKQAGIKKPDSRWQWPEGSRDLVRVRKTLGLKP